MAEKKKSEKDKTERKTGLGKGTRELGLEGWVGGVGAEL